LQASWLGNSSAGEARHEQPYTVFNVEQIEGLPDHYYAKPEARRDSVQRIAHAESFFAATGANVVHGGSRACYVPSTDNIHMPCIDFFRDAESYYATRAHETCHWTRHKSRLDREFGRKRFGDEGYARGRFKTYSG
jgi:antirestriction protein ArdC